MQIVELSDADLLARMRNFEDHLVERKVVSDNKDWKKTAVAFANSAPIGLPAVLYVGVRASGDIETPQRDLDEAQRRFNAQMEKVYPRIAYVPKIITENGRQALAIIVPGSELRPHFAGLAYVRRGSQTDPASEEQYDELIAQRSSKAGLLLRWKGKNVTVFVRTKDTEIPWPNSTVLTECNHFYATFKRFAHEPASSFPLSRIEVNFDNLRGRLQLEISDPNRNAWSIQIDRQVFEVLSSQMNHEGRQLIGHLLTRGKVECPQQFFAEIPLDVQNKQMEIAVKNGFVRRGLEQGGLRMTYYVG